MGLVVGEPDAAANEPHSWHGLKNAETATASATASMAEASTPKTDTTPKAKPTPVHRPLADKSVQDILGELAGLQWKRTHLATIPRRAGCGLPAVIG
ncbi:hypothetical protein ORV05_27560 [Amycolatopsis cynarae]|uniref:Transposase n=1 Tax=Amycolatopsis cynarae TaxID=2995223 RepID=A0ABY7AZQ6_9PSEU|nr:hypothetical protein [Amycolatopsis sp. HUAS 11-8]WAL64689.1 hypothetical protein ORV05_27560 [Amycolatopsis sp. HUAS 11-8]